MSFGDPRPAPKPSRIRPERARAPKAWRRPKADQVPPGLFGELLGRQGGRCIAVIVDPIEAGASRCMGRLTIEHTRERAAMGGPRAPSTKRWTVLACEWHHTGSSWVTSHKAEIRAWLADRSAEEGLQDGRQ